MHGQWRYGCVGGHGEGDGERLHVAPNSRGINTETKAIRRILRAKGLGSFLPPMASLGTPKRGITVLMKGQRN